LPLQHTATHVAASPNLLPFHSHCNMLQHTATHIATATHCNISSIFLFQFTIILEISCLTSTFCLADICVHFLVCFDSSEWQRPVGCLIFIFHSPQKSPIIIGSFAEKDLQHKASHASSPPCITPHSILSH